MGEQSECSKETYEDLFKRKPRFFHHNMADLPTMIWIKAFHLIAMIAWFAGLFYLPRLFVYHTMSDDQASQQRFKIMEHKLYYSIMVPSAWATILLGLTLLYGYAWQAYSKQLWLHCKLLLVFLLLLYHLYCGYLVKVFAQDKNQRSHIWYRFFNEVPAVLLIVIVILVVVKPF